jgi:L-xylulokinase
MKPQYFLSIDNGLTATKASIFALDGTEIETSVADTPVKSYGNISEIDMHVQWETTAHVIRSVLEASGLSGRDIIGIGNTGHGGGLYCLDDANRPVRYAISSMDARSNEIIAKWDLEGKNPFNRIYQKFWSGQTIPLLYWLKQNEQDNYKRIDKAMMVKDWIIFNLTGRVGIEYTDASNSGIINPLSKSIDRDLFVDFDVADALDKMPKLRKTTDIVGYVTKTAADQTGLIEGIPVIGGVFDCVACAMGSGILAENQYSLIAGTWNINSTVSDTFVDISDTTVKCSLFVDLEKLFYAESSATSAVNLDWFLRNVVHVLAPELAGSEKLYELINAEVAKIPPNEASIIYTPFLYESHLSTKLKGSFFGIEPEHGVFHMLRAIYEGIAFAHKMHIDLLSSVGIARNKAALSGGASNSPVWCQLFADVLNLEVRTTKSGQVGGLGAAICTSVALGEYAGFTAAEQAMVSIENVFTPNLAVHNVYMERYNRFRELVQKFNDI